MYGLWNMDGDMSISKKQHKIKNREKNTNNNDVILQVRWVEFVNKTLKIK